MIKTTRRVKMYVGPFDIRLMFEDQYGRSHRFFKSRERADEVFEAFVKGEFGAIKFAGFPGPPEDER